MAYIKNAVLMSIPAYRLRDRSGLPSKGRTNNSYHYLLKNRCSTTCHVFRQIIIYNFVLSIEESKNKILILIYDYVYVVCIFPFLCFYSYLKIMIHIISNIRITIIFILFLLQLQKDRFFVSGSFDEKLRVWNIVEHCGRYF